MLTDIRALADHFLIALPNINNEYDPPIILGRLFLSTVKAIIYIGTGEVHMHFPSEKVRRYFTDPNYIVEDYKQVRKRHNHK